ncbi:hypothetical protein C900_05902 [Fulvivirga imtechensis AK7]|uniref:Uncharacterized protein n=1 Tax=Fulvivirga imtechensis AK7 TaxID=1237149 RepID=L8JMH5_9BACT|nr:hypothetical protein C900_05902 [Fulvivirga imtechensis AK7]
MELFEIQLDPEGNMSDVRPLTFAGNSILSLLFIWRHATDFTSLREKSPDHTAPSFLPCD